MVYNEVRWNAMEYYGIQMECQMEYGAQWNTDGMPWNTIECNGIPWGTMECHGILWSTNGITQTTTDYAGMQWNTMEYRGRLWNCNGSVEAFGCQGLQGGHTEASRIATFRAQFGMTLHIM